MNWVCFFLSRGERRRKPSLAASSEMTIDDSTGASTSPIRTRISLGSLLLVHPTMILLVSSFLRLCFATHRHSVVNMLDEHATGWGLKREDDDIVLIWKGHNDVFVWKPAANMCRTPVDEQLSSGDGNQQTDMRQWKFVSPLVQQSNRSKQLF
nr:scarecrow-like protein 32 [Ipomoea batatas]